MATHTGKPKTNIVENGFVISVIKVSIVPALKTVF
jgi:hypothetical protein